MSTHNICFHREIRNYQIFSVDESALSAAMNMVATLFKSFTLPLTLVMLNKLRDQHPESRNLIG